MNIEKLEKLAALREKGIISEEEFIQEKDTILGKNIPEKKNNNISKYNSIKKLILTMLKLGVIIVIIIIGIRLLISTEPDKKSIIDTEVKPVVVITGTNYSKSTMFEKIATVTTTIKNIGIEGYIEVYARFYSEDGNTYIREKNIFLNKDEEMNLEFNFEEYNSGEKWEYSVSASPRRDFR